MRQKLMFICLYLIMLSQLQVLSQNIFDLEGKISCYMMDKKISFYRPVNMKLRNLSNSKNAPFGIGIDLALFADFQRKELAPGIIGFIDLNLSQKIVFLKCEYGKFYGSTEEYFSNFVSLGLNYKFVNNRKSSFYFQAALLTAWSTTEGGGISGLLGVRYLYRINEIFGFVAGFRYPFGTFSSFLSTAGFQFLTN